jgi:uncharacterized damage-inducible protein DinB
MISELEPIWQQFNETYDALRQALAEVPDDRLTWRPGPNANSVAGIVQHVAGANIAYAQVMAYGNRGPRREPVENPGRSGLCERLQESEQAVRETFERMTPEALRQPRADTWNPLGPEVDGPLDALWFALQIVRHSAYHLGQVNVYLLLLERLTEE